MFPSLGYYITSLSLYGEDPWGPSGEGRTSTCMCTCLLPYILSVLFLFIPVFSRVLKTRQLNKPDAGKVYAVVGSTYVVS